VSAPFEGGEHGQVAVKVTDDRGNKFLVVERLTEGEPPVFRNGATRLWSTGYLGDAPHSRKGWCAAESIERTEQEGRTRLDALLVASLAKGTPCGDSLGRFSWVGQSENTRWIRLVESPLTPEVCIPDSPKPRLFLFVCMGLSRTRAAS
jgi:hypothetical protein